MRSTVVWFVAALFVAALAPLGTAQAYSIEAPAGYNPGYAQSYSYTVTTVGPHGQIQGPTVQYGGTPHYASRPVPRQASALAQQQVMPQAAYRRAVPQTGKHSRRRSSYNAAERRRAQRTLSANRALPAATRPVPGQQRTQLAQQYYQSYPPQAYSAVQGGYNRAPQSSYYRTPYQNRYYGAPNYYQGYSYNNGWGSSLQNCAPGRS